MQWFFWHSWMFKIFHSAFASYLFTVLFTYSIIIILFIFFSGMERRKPPKNITKNSGNYVTSATPSQTLSVSTTTAKYFKISVFKSCDDISKKFRQDQFLCTYTIYLLFNFFYIKRRVFQTFFSPL